MMEVGGGGGAEGTYSQECRVIFFRFYFIDFGNIKLV